MARLALLTLALVLAGCSGGGDDDGPGTRVAPAWLDGDYADANLAFSYPGWWEERDSDKYGTLLTDKRSRHPAFVSVRYFAAGTLPVDDTVTARTARILRPPDGAGLTHLYTQTAYLGRFRGIESAFMWQTRARTPVGPTFRTFALELPSGETALLVFAAERPRFHSGMFAWIRETIRWAAAEPVTGRDARPARGRYVNEG